MSTTDGSLTCNNPIREVQCFYYYFMVCPIWLICHFAILLFLLLMLYLLMLLKSVSW